MKKLRGAAGLLWWLPAALVIAALARGKAQTKATAEREAHDTLRQSIKRAAVCCYAVEGRYPESMEYIEDNYGVYVDHDRYLVYYEAFAENIMPYVEVMER